MARIKNIQGTLLNSKSEWNAPPIVRIIAQNENERNQEKVNASNQINFNSVQPTPSNCMVWRGLIWAESSPENFTKLPTHSSTDQYQPSGNPCKYCDYSFQINHLRLHISLYHINHDILFANTDIFWSTFSCGPVHASMQAITANKYIGVNVNNII